MARARLPLLCCRARVSARAHPCRAAPSSCCRRRRRRTVPTAPWTTAQSLAYEPWPAYDEELCCEAGALATIAVQLNGKTLKKVTVSLPEGAGEDEAREAALGLATVAQRLDGRPVKKLIYVPGRIVNIIA